MMHFQDQSSGQPSVGTRRTMSLGSKFDDFAIQPIFIPHRSPCRAPTKSTLA